ncbi:MAG: hypothetical protein N3D77_15065 [Geminicoccaceae bacterium]|nr:hypothetical protein [Geminicoccaceae bacterium]
MKLPNLLAAATALAILAAPVAAQQQPDGSPARPFRVTLVPADGGAEDGTKADFKSLFDAVTKATGLHFDIKSARPAGRWSRRSAPV